MSKLADFDEAYRRVRFEEVRARVKSGELTGLAAGFAGTIAALELDLRRARKP